MIQLENVSVRYEDTVALHPVSLGIHEGQFTVLLGSSGAGKSTFLRCLNLMHSRISGRVRVSGFDGNWNRKALQKLRVSLCFAFSVPAIGGRAEIGAAKPETGRVA